MKKFAIIVAGGSGNRMGSDIPKQFLELSGKPVLMRTMQSFCDFDPSCELILVIPEQHWEYWAGLCLKHTFSIRHRVAVGGSTRFHSVQNGLKCMEGEGIVFIHDGVRPLVSHETLLRCYETAQISGNAIPVLPVTESLRKTEGHHSISVDRSAYFNVQTPQTFRTEQILKAYQCDYDPSFTDDASVAEKAGYTIQMVEGNPENIKITTPTDLIFAEALLER